MPLKSNVKIEQPNVVFCKVKTTKDYYALCNILSIGKWIYRGHENSEWHLQHSLERVIHERSTYIEELNKSNDLINVLVSMSKEVESFGDEYMKEYNAIRSYMSKTHQMDLSNIEALCNLQHYGGKTRLLDFTFSINIALYMALENKNKFQERCIWAINYRQLHDILVKIISEYFIKNQKNEEKFRDKFDMEGYFQNIIYNKFAKKCFYDEDSENEPYNQDIVIPIVIPDQNPRITAQNGLFLFPTTFKPFLKCLCHTFGLKIEESVSNKNDENTKEYISKRYPELYVKNKQKNFFEGYKTFNDNRTTITEAKIIKIIFSPAFESDGENILEASNITPYTIYPDFVGIAKSIVYW